MIREILEKMDKEDKIHNDINSLKKLLNKKGKLKKGKRTLSLEKNGTFTLKEPNGEIDTELGILDLAPGDLTGWN